MKLMIGKDEEIFINLSRLERRRSGEGICRTTPDFRQMSPGEKCYRTQVALPRSEDKVLTSFRVRGRTGVGEKKGKRRHGSDPCSSLMPQGPQTVSWSDLAPGSTDVNTCVGGVPSTQ